MLPDLAGWWSYGWDRLLNHYQVNPLVFSIMYGCKTVGFWWTLVLLVRRARRRLWDSLPILILANMGINVAPWVYVWAFGRNLPEWYPWVVYWLAGWGLVALVVQVRRRLHQVPGPEPVLRRRPKGEPEALGAPIP